MSMWSQAGSRSAGYTILNYGLFSLPPSDPNFYVTDGRVTLVIAPWDITDYSGAGIERPGLEHIGFKVESVDAVKKDLMALQER